MSVKEKKHTRKAIEYAVIFLLVNIAAIFFISIREKDYINESLGNHSESISEQFNLVMEDYKRSFRVFSMMMTKELENTPDEIWDHLKSMDGDLAEIEGETYDGLYMYYRDRYLYSWDTPYSQYEKTGYNAKERPWYKDAVAGGGEIVFTPPYMSYANHYILTTISQLQPDGETVFAYDIKMGDIQTLVTNLDYYDDTQVMIFDNSGTIIGSTDSDYLGGNLYMSEEEVEDALSELEQQLESADENEVDEADKIRESIDSTKAFYEFRKQFGDGTARLEKDSGKSVLLSIGSRQYYGCALGSGGYNFMILVPRLGMLKETMDIWLIPLLIIEILLIYVLGSLGRARRNRELKEAYVELGQTQRRLEIALSVAQKAAAIDDLTGMMNDKSFRKGMGEALDAMEPDESAIFIMIDGDHFKQVNDNYGHSVGDEVIKLCAQMIIGRIRTVDLASRLHGDEFALFIANTGDFAVAEHIMQDINKSLEKEAARRNMPSITLSAGAVRARKGDNYSALTKAADEALYKAKETHNGGFSYNE